MKARKRAVNPVFGVPLKKGDSSVPAIVRQIVEFLDKKGHETEGLFRVSGSLDDVERLRRFYDKGKPIDLSQENVHVIAGVFKLFLRELPDPLFPSTSYSAIMNILDESPATQIPKTQEILAGLPHENRVLLKYLVLFLKRVSEKSSVNKMHASNLAIVFAPSVLRGDASSLLDASSESNAVMEFLIHDSSVIFENEPDAVFEAPIQLKSSWSHASRPTDSDLASVLEKELQKLNGGTDSADVSIQLKSNWNRTSRPADSDLASLLEKELQLLEQGTTPDKSEISIQLKTNWNRNSRPADSGLASVLEKELQKLKEEQASSSDDSGLPRPVFIRSSEPMLLHKLTELHGQSSTDGIVRSPVSLPPAGASKTSRPYSQSARNVSYTSPQLREARTGLPPRPPRKTNSINANDLGISVPTPPSRTRPQSARVSELPISKQLPSKRFASDQTG